MILATLCYIRDNGRTLMLHRVKKENDVHEGKWNGVGGKFEPGESPEECCIREIREECGLEVRDPHLRGILTFPDFAKGHDWYVFVFEIRHFSGAIGECAEGNLEWIEDGRILDLNLWEGDRIFLKWLVETDKFFSGKFIYRDGALVSHTGVLHD